MWYVYLEEIKYFLQDVSPNAGVPVLRVKGDRDRPDLFCDFDWLARVCDLLIQFNPAAAAVAAGTSSTGTTGVGGKDVDT